MATSVSTIYHHDKRRYARFAFERSVKLFSGDYTSQQYSAKNLSLGGMFLEGQGDLTVGQDCRIELHETGRRSSLIYKICGKIVHAAADGLGVEFVTMEEHSLMYVQTMFLYSADDPVAAAEHLDEAITVTTTSSTC